MNDKLRAEVRKVREENPLMSMDHCLAVARATKVAHDEWEHVPGTGERYKRTKDGFTLYLVSEVESENPKDDDLGHYVKATHADYSYEWQGNYPQPSEEFPLGLPYTSFYSAGYTRNPEHVWPYFVPDGIEDWYEHARQMGQSKSVAWDLTKAWVENAIREFFGGPLVYLTVTVEAHRKGVELGSASIGTSVIGFDDDYIFACANECGLVDDAIDEAKEKLDELREDGDDDD